MLKELTTHHREIARLKFEGAKAAEISERLNQPISTVRSVLADPLCKSHIARLNDKADSYVVQVRKKIAETSIHAIDRQAEMLAPEAENVPYSVVASVAKDVLDRAGHAAPQQVNHAHAIFTVDKLRELRKEAEAQGADLLEADYEEVG